MRTEEPVLSELPPASPPGARCPCLRILTTLPPRSSVLPVRGGSSLLESQSGSGPGAALPSWGPTPGRACLGARRGQGGARSSLQAGTRQGHRLALTVSQRESCVPEAFLEPGRGAGWKNRGAVRAPSSCRGRRVAMRVPACPGWPTPQPWRHPGPRARPFWDPSYLHCGSG